MITKITAHNFKGNTFEFNPRPKTLMVGPNGAGKSARSQAALLAVLGYVPGTGKRNADIFEAFHDGVGKDLRVGVVVDNGQKIERRFTQAKSGTVSQDLYLGSMKASPADFARATAGIGIVDLSAFLALSDAKKVDLLFSLFPPEGDVGAITDKIADLAGKISALERQEREAESTVTNLRARRSKIELPAGTLADKRAEIEQTEADYNQAVQDLHNEKMDQARAEEQAKAQAAPPANPGTVAASAPPPPAPQESPRSASPAPAPSFTHLAQQAANLDAQAILLRILATMDRAGCEVCAARMVIKSELAKMNKPTEAAA
jgi:uncharacterized protein YhaN